MATQAFVGRGGQLYRGDVGTPTNFVKVEEMVSVGGMGGTAPQVTATHLESTAAEKLSGLPDTEAIPCVANWLPTHATHNETTGIMADFENGTQRYWQIVWKKLGVVVKRATFLATVSDAKTSDLTNENVVQLNFTLQRSGAPTWADS